VCAPPSFFSVKETISATSFRVLVKKKRKGGRKKGGKKSGQIGLVTGFFLGKKTGLPGLLLAEKRGKKKRGGKRGEGRQSPCGWFLPYCAEKNGIWHSGTGRGVKGGKEEKGEKKKGGLGVDPLITWSKTEFGNSSS